MSDWAASLTYYGLLAVFPALIALVGMIGLVGDPASTTKTMTQIVTKLGPSSAAQTFAGPIKSITAHKSTAGIMGIVGIAAALWSASSYVGAFMRASNVIYETPEGRPIWKLRPLQVLVTLVMVVLLALVALALVLTGPIVSAVARPLGIGSTAVRVWNIAKWPVLLIVVVRWSRCCSTPRPTSSCAGFRWVMPGALFAMVVWLIASALFAFYVANFSSYDKTYGTLGGVVVFLVWLWLTNTALLLGHGAQRRARADPGAEGRRGRRRPRDPARRPQRAETTEDDLIGLRETVAARGHATRTRKCCAPAVALSAAQQLPSLSRRMLRTPPGGGGGATFSGRAPLQVPPPWEATSRAGSVAR